MKANRLNKILDGINELHIEYFQQSRKTKLKK